MIVGEPDIFGQVKKSLKNSQKHNFVNSELDNVFSKAIHLSKDIRIMNCDKVSDKFHARFSAIKRHYLYRTRNNKYLLDRNYTWSTEKLDLDKLNNLSLIHISEPTRPY